MAMAFARFEHPDGANGDIAGGQAERNAGALARGGSGRTEAIAIDTAGNYRDAILSDSRFTRVSATAREMAATPSTAC